MPDIVKHDAAAIHIQFSNEFWELMGRYKESMSQLEYIALLSNFVGRLIAAQNTTSESTAFEVLEWNMKQGMESIRVSIEDAQRKAEQDATATSARHDTH